MELALQRWAGYQRCTEQVQSGLDAGLCGCFGMLLWHLPDSCCLSYTILLMLRLGVIWKAYVPFNGNHKSQRASEKYRAWLPCCLQCFTCTFSLPYSPFWGVTYFLYRKESTFILVSVGGCFVCFQTATAKGFITIWNSQWQNPLLLEEELQDRRTTWKYFQWLLEN